MFAGNTMEGFQSNTFLPPLVFGPSGGGTALMGNQGNAAAGSTQGGSNGNASQNNGIGPSWPINPSGEFPPDGGTGY